MSNEISKNGLEATLKSADTEEWIDLLFYRPVGYRWALLFHKMGVTPNAITIASIFLGVAAGILFYYNDLLLNVIGMCLLVWANMYDSADGQLARMTGQKSEIGRILDGVSGDFWFISIYAAICLRLTPEWSYWIWILAAVTGLCHSKQAAMADYYRNIHLFFLKGKSGSELDNYVQQKPFTTLCPGKKISSGNSSFGFIAIIPVLRSVLLRLSSVFSLCCSNDTVQWLHRRSVTNSAGRVCR